MGYLRGFTRQIFSLIVLAGTVLAVIFLSRPFGSLLGSIGLRGVLPEAFYPELILVAIAALIIFLVIMITAHTVRIALARKKRAKNKQEGKQRPKKHIVNRILGGVFRCLFAFVLVSGLMSLLGFAAGTGIGFLQPLNDFISNQGAITRFFFDGDWLTRIWGFIAGSA